MVASSLWIKCSHLACGTGSGKWPKQLRHRAFIPPDQTASFQKVLDEGIERLTRMGLSHEARLQRGQPAERIAAVAREISGDLVVVGHRRQGVIAGWLLGSVTADLTNSLPFSLLVARKEISDELLFAKRQEQAD